MDFYRGPAQDQLMWRIIKLDMFERKMTVSAHLCAGQKLSGSPYSGRPILESFVIVEKRRYVADDRMFTLGCFFLRGCDGDDVCISFDDPGRGLAFSATKDWLKGCWALQTVRRRQ